MRFNKWPFRRFSLSQLSIDIRNNSNKSFVCPLTSGGETSTHCRARAAEQNVLSAPLSPLLSPWCALWCSALCRMCTARFPVWLQRSPPCAQVQPTRTRMGETAARRSKRQEGSSPDNLFQETMVGQPSTWPPVSTHLSSRVTGFAKKFWAAAAAGCWAARLQWGVSVLETGARDGGPVGPGGSSTHCFHEPPESHITRPAVAGGRRGGGADLSRPQDGPRLVPSPSYCFFDSLTPLVQECCNLGDQSRVTLQFR